MSIYLVLGSLSLIYIIRKMLFRKKVERNFGPWAVVTGATDGIGAEYASQLASKGVNIVLISRSESKLGNFATHLNSKYNVKVRTIAVDFTGGVEIYPKIQLALEGLEVTTLINNVGMSQPSPCFMHELEADKLMNLLNCNILSMTMMSRLVLPSMLERKCGYIVNVGSMAAEVSFPFLSIYAATKAYVDKLSHDMSLEYGDKGIFVQSLVPACVATKMSHIDKASFFSPGPEEFVASALKSLGRERRTPGYVGHKLQMYWFRALRIFFNPIFDKYNHHVMNSWRLISKYKKEGEVNVNDTKLAE